MRVFYGNDYISVGKKELLEWEVIKPQIIDIICNHFTKGNQLFTSNPEPKVIISANLGYSDTSR